jgi:hypothetical protein
MNRFSVASTYLSTEGMHPTLEAHSRSEAVFFRNRLD